MPDLLAEITHAAKAYYTQANALPLTATEFFEWWATLTVSRQAEVTARGFAASRAGPDFLRYCLKVRGYDMWGFMAEQLSIAAYQLWIPITSSTATCPRTA